MQTHVRHFLAMALGLLLTFAMANVAAAQPGRIPLEDDRIPPDDVVPSQPQPTRPTPSGTKPADDGPSWTPPPAVMVPPSQALRGVMPAQRPGQVVLQSPPIVSDAEICCETGASCSTCDLFVEACKAPQAGCSYVQAEALFLRRELDNSLPLVVDTTDGTVVLSNADLNFDHSTGPLLRVGYIIPNSHGIEASYFGLQEWSDSATALGAGNLDLAGPLSTQLPGLVSADLARVDYEASLHNAELNYLVNRGAWTGLIGARYLRYDENYGLLFQTAGQVPPPTETRYTIETVNDLIGLNLGLRYRRQWDLVGLELSGQGGVFANLAEQSTVLTSTGALAPAANFSTTSDDLAFVGEVGLTAFLQLTENIWLRGGYRVYWIDGVALAPDQLNLNALPTAADGIDNNGNILLHGATVGLEARW